ncbi:hypothetical protein [Oligoflexus tunisiensis]|uniref:hypothetical protein n=1 Tax=Oligoflexus tunisiensis TaxID=708132 RepID=UPI00114D2F3B|nr:hypothetical protein [Oligoflexus tunisiensis]
MHCKILILLWSIALFSCSFNDEEVSGDPEKDAEAKIRAEAEVETQRLSVEMTAIRSELKLISQDNSCSSNESCRLVWVGSSGCNPTYFEVFSSESVRFPEVAVLKEKYAGLEREIGKYVSPVIGTCHKLPDPEFKCIEDKCTVECTEKFCEGQRLP